jgi:ankyrin repeat protein
MKRLFDPKKPYLAAWTWIHDVERNDKRIIDDLAECPSPLKATTPLYYATYFGFTELAKHLIVTHKEDVNAGHGRYEAPLHAASRNGHLDAARLLLDHGADVNLSKGGRIPLRRAYEGRHLEVMRLLLEHGADVDKRDNHPLGTVLHHASYEGQVDAVRLLLQHEANANAVGYRNQTPLHLASYPPKPIEVVRLLLEYGADMDAKYGADFSSFRFAELLGRQDIVQVMLEHREKKIGGLAST